MPVKQFRDSDGCYSYLIWCDQEKLAAVVDPNHNGDLYLSALKDMALKLIYVIDTHTHVDHDSLSGFLAQNTGAQVVMHPAYGEQRKLGATFTGNDAIVKHLAFNGAIAVDFSPQDGEVIYVGTVPIRFLYTPGHTLDSISLLVENRILTGDILMIGTCGRTDFPGGSNENMYESLFDKLLPLGEEFIIYPAHDYQNNINSVMGYEKIHNPFLKVRSREEFIQFAAESFAKLPSMSGSGDKIQCSLVPPSQAPETPAAPSAAPANPLMGQMCSAMEYYFKNIPQHWNLVGHQEMLEIIQKNSREILLLDVRQPKEFAEGYIPGAINLPIRDLPTRIKELPANLEMPIITLCESGSRSAYAAMFLRGYGYSHVRSLDLGMHRWREMKLPLAK
ncbi:MBL fold metallo-hydrolase [Desulforamulus ruminis]|uniref:Rhodanese domain protein n=1 Tax=Desulforamulus ruminis (strain ATCC 23193 / DSM 2154 / NCIMB 8452 / DL) TaxID=696281 RepID=F6DUV7_DESRL|nr:MBL fold metallo-hydrolase [Desulforamulus ruminis]AEG61354.1 Rhodanese domain protein [Desulforamulus ruminis DSM 2154]